MIFRGMTPFSHSRTVVTNVSEVLVAYMFRVEAGGSRFLHLYKGFLCVKDFFVLARGTESKQSVNL
jgi:hypothetical protein